MRILAVSDLHLDAQHRQTLLNHAREADLVIVAGDLGQRRQGLAEYLGPMEGIAAKTIVVPGNNETEAELRAAIPATVLHGQTTVSNGMCVAGLGGAVPPLPPLPWGSFDLTEDEAAEQLRRAGPADILVSHSPPKGCGDWHSRRGNIGSEAILDYARRVQPKLILCGHVHDSWGWRGTIGTTRVANLGPVPVWFDTDDWEKGSCPA
ncbi:serine/threonine protein phosphatase [Loktanella sp. IMCC34160]|nr:metallophosphoesterase [Loktanella sp. IMCC34160]RYG90430.1 serine/threonine protein phosphatase [Loktanella sp. IMCC34160]